MRLSEAILLGRVTVTPRSGQLASCALGMAANARGIDADYQKINREWPWLAKRLVLPCECFCAGEGMLQIAHLFDSHVMSPYAKPTLTLEQLVDWVRSVEPAEVEVGEIQNEQAGSGQGPFPKLCLEATEV